MQTVQTKSGEREFPGDHVVCVKYYIGIPGAYHVGLAIDGYEYTFDANQDKDIICNGKYSIPSSEPKIYRYIEPGKFNGHIADDAVDCGKCLDYNSLYDITNKWEKKWMKQKYNYLRNNCSDACNDLAIMLGVGGIPWSINRHAIIARKICPWDLPLGGIILSSQSMNGIVSSSISGSLGLVSSSLKSSISLIKGE